MSISGMAPSDVIPMHIRPAVNGELVWFCKQLGYAPGVDIKGIVHSNDNPARPSPFTMVGLDHWTEGSCEMHILVSMSAGPSTTASPISRRFIREVLNYVFKSGRTVIIGRTPANNQKALELSQRIGFEPFWRVKGGHKPDESLVFSELTRAKALKWFPDHIIDRYYKGVPWLEEAKKEAAALSPAKLPDLTDWLTKTPPLSPGVTLKPSSEFWRKPWPEKKGGPVPVSIPDYKKYYMDVLREEEKKREQAEMDKKAWNVLRGKMAASLTAENKLLRDLMEQQARIEKEVEGACGSAGVTSSSTTDSPSGSLKNSS